MDTAAKPLPTSERGDATWPVHLRQQNLKQGRAQAAINNPGSYTHCSCFTAKSLHRRLARQASLLGRDPVLTTFTTKEPQLGVVEDDTPESEV